MSISKLWRRLTCFLEFIFKRRRNQTMGPKLGKVAIQCINKEKEDGFFSVLVENNVQFDIAGYGVVIIREEVLGDTKEWLKKKELSEKKDWRVVRVSSFSKIEKEKPELAQFIRKNRFHKSIPTRFRKSTSA